MIELFTTNEKTIKLANLREALASALKDEDIDLALSYLEDIRSVATEIELNLNSYSTHNR